MKTASLYSRLYLRALRSGLSILHDPRPIQQTIRKLQRQMDEYYAANIAA